MAVEVSGGGLVFDATVDTSGLDGGVDHITQVADDLAKSFDNLNASGAKVGDTFSSTSDTAKQFADDLAKVGQATGQTFNPADVQKYTSAVQLATTTLVPLMSTLSQNVGADKFAQLQKDISGTNDAGKQLQITLSFVKDNIGALNLPSDGATQLASAIDGLQGQFSGLIGQADQVSTHTNTVLTQLRALKNVLATADKDSPLYAQSLEQAEKLENSLKNVNTTLELTGKNTAPLEALTEGVKGLIGGFEAYEGILGLTATSDEQLQRSITSVVAAMGILNGIQEVASVLDTRSALNVFLLQTYRKLTAQATADQAAATGLLVEAQEAEIGSTEGATVAQEELNVAMDANPAGILLLVLGGIVLALQAFGQNTQLAGEQQIAFNNGLKEAQGIITELADAEKDLYEERAKDAESEVSIAQAEGKSQTDILALKAKAIIAQQQANQATLVGLGYSRQVYEDQVAELQVRQEQLQAVLTANAGTKDLSKEDQQRADILKSQVDLLKSQIDPIKAALAATQQANAEAKANAAAQQKLATDNALNSAAAAADATLILSKKNTQEQLDAQLAAIKTQQAASLNNANLTQGEVDKINAQAQKDTENAERAFKIVQLNDTQDVLQAQLNSVKQGTAQELQLKIDAVNTAAAIEQAADGVTADKSIAIQAAAGKKTTDLIKQFTIANQETQINTVIAGINTNLTAVQKGSVEELQLKEQLVDQKAALDVVSTTGQIQNETLLAAKILEINTTANVAKKKLVDDYYDHILETDQKIIDAQVATQNAPLQGIVNNPLSSQIQVFNAQQQILQNELNGVKQQMQEVLVDIVNGTGNVNTLEQKLLQLQAKAAQLQANITNGTAKETIAQLTSIASKSEAISGALGGLANSLTDSNPELAAVIKQLQSITDIASKAATAISDVVSGNYVGAVVSTIGLVTSAISGLFNNSGAAKEAALVKQMEQDALIGEIEITRQFDQQLVDAQKINDTRLAGIREYQAALNQQATDTQTQFDNLLAQIQQLKGQRTPTAADIAANPLAIFSGVFTFSLAGLTYDQLNDLFLKGELSDSAKALFQELQQLKADGADVTQALADAQAQVDQIFTGTTADDLASTIEDGFKQGLRSAADFADDFHDFIVNAMLSALEAKSLQPALDQFYADFAAASEASGGTLTPDQIAHFQNIYNQIIGNFTDQINNLQAISGINLASSDSSTAGSNSLTGAIKGITEDQAELLAGQFGGLRLTAIDQLNIATQSFKSLQNIEGYTENLIDVKAILSRLELNGIKVK